MCESKKKFALFEIEFKPITIVFSIIWWLCARESISLVALEIIESLNQTIVGNSSVSLAWSLSNQISTIYLLFFTTTTNK